MNPAFPLKSAFLALPLEAESQRRFQALQEKLKPFSSFLRFQNPQSPHLTLYFWKELLEIEYAPMIAKAQNIADRTQPFSLQINGANTFGKSGSEHVLFLTVAFSPQLATLKKLCPWPHLRSGYGGQANPPGQEFHPHITIARISHPQKFAVHRKKIMKVFENIDFTMNVDRIRLYGEINGVKQTVIKEWFFYPSP